MKIDRIIIENFRNFSKLDVYLHEHAVIVGENKVGKSNLLYALRLIFDPSLPESARQLRREDFWDGGGRKLTKDDSILISVDLSEFEDDANQFAILSDHLIEPSPAVARLTYLFRPLPALGGDPSKDIDYEFLTFGGNRPENRFGYELRSRLPLDVLQALRDAEGDLAQWRRSPLRPLLEEVVERIEADDLEKLSREVNDAMDEVRSHESIQELGVRLGRRLVDMVGKGHAVDAELRFSPTDPGRLFRALRLFIDGGSRGIGEASLGTANLIYLALKSLELEQLISKGLRDHSLLGIEEPEAHLHPHIQRLVYRDFLRPRSHHGAEDKPDQLRRKNTTVILTTHSPHVVSVAPLRSLVLLKTVREDRSTKASSTARVDLSESDVADLERYLDVTRGEMLFARGVLLVEGDAELFLVPRLARLIGVDLDGLGITVCSVAGTNFTPYVKILGEGGLKIPFAVVTDLDPSEEDNLGEPRVKRLLEATLSTEMYEQATRVGEFQTNARKHGYFLNDHTFEIDLFQAGHHEILCRALTDLTTNKKAQERAAKWQDDPKSLDKERFLKDVEGIGKGRYAQRLASTLAEGITPEYIQRAIHHVAERI